MNDSPDRSRVFLRVLVRFLALFLVPVVVIATPSVGNAATVYGDPEAFTVSLSDVLTDSFDCTGSGQWVVPDTTGLLSPYVKFANIKCGSTAALGNQYGCDSDDCASLSVLVEGEGCAGSGSAPVVSDTTGWHNFAGPSIALDPLCDVSSVCITFNGYANNMPDMGADKQCVGWALGVAPEMPDAPSSGCVHYTPVGLITRTAAWDGNAVQMGIRLTAPATETAYIQVMARYNDGYDNNRGYPFDFSVKMVTGQTDAWPDPNKGGWGKPFLGLKSFMLGYEGAVDVNSGSTVFNSPGYNNNSALAPSGYWGRGDPANCVFYFGPKVYDDTTTTRDEPWGSSAEVTGGSTGSDSGTPIGDDAAPAPGASDTADESCTEGFSLWNPASWLSAGYCEIVSGLSTVARGVLGIPGKILGGLRSLFVPADAPSWSDVPSPLKSGWVPSFDSVSAGSCAPVVMPRLDLQYANVKVGPTTLFDTCDDPWPLVRTFTYNGLLALLLVGAIWKAFHAAAAALGMNVSNDSGDTDDH